MPAPENPHAHNDPLPRAPRRPGHRRSDCRWPGPRPGTPRAAAACQSTVSGDLRLHTLASAAFGNARTIRVLLPPGYGAPANQGSRRYPVLYLLDGQNLFDACLSDVSHHEWGVDETLDQQLDRRAVRSRR